MHRLKCIVKNSHARVDEASNTRDRWTLHITHKHLEFTKGKKKVMQLKYVLYPNVKTQR